MSDTFDNLCDTIVYHAAEHVGSLFTDLAHLCIRIKFAEFIETDRQALEDLRSIMHYEG